MCIQSFDVPSRSRLRGVLRVLSALVFVAAATLAAWSARAERIEDPGPIERVRPNQPIACDAVRGAQQRVPAPPRDDVG